MSEGKTPFSHASKSTQIELGPETYTLHHDEVLGLCQCCQQCFANMHYQKGKMEMLATEICPVCLKKMRYCQR